MEERGTDKVENMATQGQELADPLAFSVANDTPETDLFNAPDTKVAKQFREQESEKMELIPSSLQKW